MISVLIADDHPVIRRGLTSIIMEVPDITVAGVAEKGHEVIGKLAETKPDVLLLDLSMPGMNGIDVLKQMNAEGISVPVLIFSIHSEEQYAIRALKLGAAGYLQKEMVEEELVEAIRTAYSGKRYISPGVAAGLADYIENKSWENPLDKLSEREYQVFSRIAEGKSMKEIGAELHISPPTVSTYKSRLLEKLNLKTEMELLKFALEQKQFR